ncbi:MAG: hypothetical protein K2O85_02910, partial [Helicobacter sp.]|nr:hypothetical protein [Helicobacter sp.]
MRDKLIKQGIPKDEIAFIHDYTTDAQKAKLFADVNAGKIRFLFGSTKKMGAGMNVQERIVGLHHIDAAWNPADMEQRDGRAIRQGNLLAEKYADFKIKIFSYVTENSCDAVYYSKLEQKATSIKNFRSGHAQKEDMSDDVILTLEELKALATGDTRELEKASLNKELQNVQYQLNALKSADAFQEIERQNCTKDIKILPQEIANLKDDLEIAKQRKIRKLSESEKESLRNLEIVPDNKEPLFRLDNYDVFLEKSPRGIYTLSAISDNGNEIVLLKQSEPPKNLAHFAQKLIEQSSAASIEARIAQREEELKNAHAKLKSIEQSTTGKEIATLEAKEKELSGKIAKLIKEMSAQPKNATKEESAKATTNLTAYQQQLLQRELAEFNAKFKEDSTVNPQQIDITDLESLATFFNGWRSVKDPIRAEDLLNGEFLKEMMFQTNNKEFAHLLKNLEAISLSVDPKKDEYGIWKAFKAIQSDTDRAHITKERKLDKKKDPTRYAKEQERCRENLQENRERIEKALDIKPIQEFGTNYAEFYHDGVGAIKKLIAESKDYQSRKKAKELTKEEQENNAFKGQVTGAFYREDLGDITIAWGEVTDAKNHKGYGLAHILDKHPDFDVNLIAEIMEKGKLNIQNDVRARLEYGDYIVGLSREFKGEEANFIITAFEKNNGNKGSFSPKPKITDESDNVSPTHTDDSTPPNIKNGLEKGETHESLQQQLQQVERELATNRER